MTKRKEYEEFGFQNDKKKGEILTLIVNKS